MGVPVVTSYSKVVEGIKNVLAGVSRHNDTVLIVCREGDLVKLCVASKSTALRGEAYVVPFAVDDGCIAWYITPNTYVKPITSLPKSFIKYFKALNFLRYYVVDYRVTEFILKKINYLVRERRNGSTLIELTPTDEVSIASARFIDFILKRRVDDVEVPPKYYLVDGDSVVTYPLIIPPSPFILGEELENSRGVVEEFRESRGGDADFIIDAHLRRKGLVRSVILAIPSKEMVGDEGVALINNRLNNMIKQYSAKAYTVRLLIPSIDEDKADEIRKIVDRVNKELGDHKVIMAETYLPQDFIINTLITELSKCQRSKEKLKQKVSSKGRKSRSITVWKYVIDKKISQLKRALAELTKRNP